MGAGLDFETFYATEFQRVYKAIYLTTADPDLAQDVTQEAFKLSFIRWRRLARKPWAGGWVMTTALNLMRKELKRPRSAELKDAMLPHSLDRTEEGLVEALRSLPHRQRTAAVLYCVIDMPVSEIAHTMDVAEGTVKALLSQARERLSQALDGDHG